MARTMRLCTVLVQSLLLAALGVVGVLPASPPLHGVVVVHSTGGPLAAHWRPTGGPLGPALEGSCGSAWEACAGTQFQEVSDSRGAEGDLEGRDPQGLGGIGPGFKWGVGEWGIVVVVGHLVPGVFLLAVPL